MIQFGDVTATDVLRRAVFLQAQCVVLVDLKVWDEEVKNGRSIREEQDMSLVPVL